MFSPPFQLAQTRSHDHHVTVELVRTYLKLGDVAQAKQVPYVCMCLHLLKLDAVVPYIIRTCSILKLLGKLAASMDAESGVVAALQGEVYFAQKDYSKSVERLCPLYVISARSTPSSTKTLPITEWLHVVCVPSLLQCVSLTLLQAGRSDVSPAAAAAAAVCQTPLHQGTGIVEHVWSGQDTSILLLLASVCL